MGEYTWYPFHTDTVYQYACLSSIGMNHQPGIGIGIGLNVQSGIGISMVVSVEHYF